MATDRQVIVVGGGIAGLSAALWRAECGIDVELFEAAARPGGHFLAETHDGYMFARGPHGYPASAEAAVALVRLLGLLPRAKPAAGPGTRYLFHDGRLRALPRSPAGLATTRLLTWRGKASLLAEPLRRRRRQDGEAEESAFEFFARRMGAEAALTFVDPFVSGIFAGDAAELGARSAFPRLTGWEREHGSLVLGALRSRGSAGAGRAVLHSFPDGLGEMASACVARLGDRVHAGHAVERIVREGGRWRVVAGGLERTAARVVCALPPPETARLLEPLDAEAARLVATVPMAPVAVVHLGGPLSAHRRPPGGFGVLVPRSAGLSTLGIVFSSSIFPERAPAGAWLQASYLGGVGDPGVLDRDDDALRALAARETAAILGIDPDAGACRVMRHRAGIPQLVRGHERRVRTLRARVAALGGLSLAGNWLDGVSLDHAIRSGLPTAAEVAG